MISRRRQGALIIREVFGAPIWGFVIGIVVFPQLAVPLYYPALWTRDAPVLACYAVVLAVALVWGCVRLCRMGVRFDDGGVTVRNFWRTWKISWDHLLVLTDGGNEKGAWALQVVCRDGRSFTAQGTMSIAKQEVLTAIGQVAERYQARIELTGQPSYVVPHNSARS